MLKKFFTYPVFLVLFLSVIGIMGSGAIIKYHYTGGEKYQFLQKPLLFIAEVPINFSKMIKHRSIIFDKPQIVTKHKDKKRFEQFIENKRNALLVLPRYEHSLNRSVVDIIDLNNFEVIHTYKHDIAKGSQIRFQYIHPLLLDDGSIISSDEYAPGFKIDFCSNLQWIKDKEKFHHNKMLDHEENIWVSGQMNPRSKYVEKFAIDDFSDDSIIKINTKGKILFNKSVTEILIENNLVDVNLFRQNYIDPIHLNDIEPAFTDTEYWQQGDVFISIRHQSAIIHYRPSTNKVINYITGPFAQQHDADIISDKEISIFNNNNFFVDNEHSEVVIYNFETKTFKKLFNDQLQKENIKTDSGGISHTFKDGSLIVEEQNHGRIILFNSKGEKEWEFVNKDKNGDVGVINSSRVIEDELFIEKFKFLVKDKKCLN